MKILLPLLILIMTGCHLQKQATIVMYKDRSGTEFVIMDGDTIPLDTLLAPQNLSNWNTPAEDWMTLKDWHQYLICASSEGDWGCDSCYYMVWYTWPE